jgi:hypothetical protein
MVQPRVLHGIKVEILQSAKDALLRMTMHACV